MTVLSWSDFKTLVDQKNISIQYIEYIDFYELSLVDGSYVIGCNLLKDAGPDQTDFEDNYKDNGNKVIKQKTDIYNGTIVGTNEFVIDCTLGYGTLYAQITGTWSGTLFFEATVNGAVWFDISGTNTADLNGQIPNYTGANANFAFNAAGLAAIRIRSIGLGITGTAEISCGGSYSNTIITAVHSTTFVSGSIIDSALPTGASTSALQTTGNTTLSTINGKLQTLGQNTMANSMPVAIASNQSAIPASQSGTWTVQPGNTANTTAWKVDGSAVTQPISGSVTATQATGTNLHTVVDSGIITTITNVVHVDDNAGSLTVDGTGNFTVVQATGSNLHTVIDSGTVTNLSQLGGTAISMNTGVRDAGTQRVTIATNDAVPVTDNSGSLTVDNNGTFVVQATVSAGATNIAKAEDVLSADGDVGVPTLAVRKATPANTSGTDGDYEFLQISAGRLWASATIDAALPTGANTIGALSANQTVNNNQIGGVGISTGNGVVGTGVQRVAIASDNTAFSVNATPPTLTKATQGATGYSTQDLKDAGRTHINFYAVAAASGATTVETAITLTKSSGTGATSTGTSFVITNGKRFRITHLSVATRGNTTATVQTTTFNLRLNTAGAVITSSTPIVFAARSATAAVASAWDRYIIPIPDGFEILGDGTLQFGITAAATFTTNAPTWDVNIIGFEY